MQPVPGRPLPESYWVIPGQFLAGEYPGSAYSPERARQRLAALLAAGFDTFIDLTSQGEVPPYEPTLRQEAEEYGLEVTYRRFAINDYGLPGHEQMQAILDHLDEAVSRGHKIYLHCQGGIGRTGTTVGCYLARHGLPGQQALDQLADWWRSVPKSAFHPHSPETRQQEEFVRQWPTRAIDWHLRYRQQARWTKNTRDYLFQRAGLDSAKRVLEVGCGTGALWEQWALPPGAEPHGLDLSLDTVKQARHHAPGLCAVNAAGEQLPYPDSCFNLTFCHYLLLWVTDPVRLLREMARVTRPGGSVLALAEPDHAARIDEPEELQSIGRWQTEALVRQGINPRMGRELAGAFARAGITLVENGVIGGGWNAPTTDETELEWAVLESDLAGQVSAPDIQKIKVLDLRARHAGARVLFVPTFYAWGRVCKGDAV